MDNFIRRLISPPEKKISKFVTAGCMAADIGCGPGYFTIPLAETVGPSGRVYAADPDSKAINALNEKIDARGLRKVIEVKATSAAKLEFIPDTSIDFAFANGVLCCMLDHSGAVAEIKRILKPHRLCYLSVSKLIRKKDPRSVPKDEWIRILKDFDVQEIGEGFMNRWATLSLKSANRESNNGFTSSYSTNRHQLG